MSAFEDTGRFIVYRSSAGSGKTHNLVRTFLSLALQTDDPSRYRSILAITFTNKASHEMKERVITTLKAMSRDEEPPAMFHQVMKDLGLSETELRKRARNTLRHLLHHYTDLSISTIDKFVHRIISNFARDLKLPMDFELEVEEDEVLEKAISLLVSRAGEDKDLTRALVEFTEAKAADEKSWHVEQDLKAFARRTLDEEGLHHLEELRELSVHEILEVRQTLTRRIKTFEEKVRSIGEQGVRLLEENDIPLKAMAHGKSGIGQYFHYLKEVRSDKLQPNKTVAEKVIGQGKWVASKAEEAEAAAIERVRPQLEQRYHQAQDLIDQEFSRYQLDRLVSKNLYALALVNEIEKVLLEIKEENDLLMISDMNKIISGIVLHEPAPFIYERIGNRYRDLLVDEFQDTSVMQWQNLLPLVENSLSTGHTAMLVGDGKQAIYRWRNGDVEQFHRLPALEAPESAPDLKEKEHLLKASFQEELLETNRRSRKNIVTFNNAFFAQLADLLTTDLRTIYEDVTQQPLDHSKKEGGYVRVEAFGEEGDQESYEEQTLKRVHQLVQEVLEQGYEKREVAILTRSNKDGSKTAEHLIRKGIDVISSESLLLENSPEVTFLSSFLQYLLDGSNDENKAFLVEYLLRQKDRLKELPEVMERYAIRPRKESRTAHIDLEAFLQEYQLPHDLSWLLQEPVYEAFERLISLFQLDKQADPYIQCFLDHAHRFTQKHGNDPDRFLEDWEERKSKLSITIPKGSNAVEVMTLHKAKGLQFPVVIMPFTSWRIRNSKDQLWASTPELPSPLSSMLVPVKKELQDTSLALLYEQEQDRSLLDEINLLYVGMTRPQDQLYILTRPKKGTIGGHLTDALGSAQFPLNEQGVMETGEVPFHLQPSRAEDKVIELSRVFSTNWREKLRISRQAPEAWNIEDPERASEYGNLVHTLLSRLRSYEDVDRVLDRMCDEGALSRSEAGKLKRKTEEVFKDPDIRSWFAPGLNVKTETDLLTPKGHTLRPDRVVLQGEQATVIDHKTGIPREKHEEQLRTYGKHLKGMGYSEVKQYLLYFDEEQLVEVV